MHPWLARWERGLPDNQKYRPQVTRRSRALQVRGMAYRVHEWGEPRHPALLMLHGWGDCGASFQFTVDALQRDWYVLAPDWRGFGDSAHNTGAYWFPDYVADLDALLTALSLPAPYRLIGHSMGGNIAALFAGAFPERVGALVNVEGFGLPDSDPTDAPARYRKWVEAVRDRREHPGYADIDELVERILQRSPRMPRQRARFVAEQWSAPDAAGRWHLKADMAHRWPNAILYRRAEARACWQQVTAPTLLVSGTATDFTGAAASWRDPDYPHARHVRIDDAGHMVHFEQPAALAREIESFLA